MMDGMKNIDSEPSYIQLQPLIEFHQQNPSQNHNKLLHSLYLMASEYYKLRFWLDGWVEYCHIDILKNWFEKAGNETKKKILERCKATGLGFLVDQDVKVKQSDEIETALFSGILPVIEEELLKATESIKVAVAWFTQPALFDALCSQLKDGVSVELIIINDPINNNEAGLPWNLFIELGGDLYFSETLGKKSHKKMHHKFCIIDDKVLFNGSYNWTKSAEKYNQENTILFKGKPDLIKQFLESFTRLKGLLSPKIETVTPWSLDALPKFGNSYFISALVEDFFLKAKEIHDAPQQGKSQKFAQQLLEKVIKVQPNHKEAIKLLEEIRPAVSLEKQEEIVQKRIAEVLKEDIVNSPASNLENREKKPSHSELVSKAKTRASTVVQAKKDMKVEQQKTRLTSSSTIPSSILNREKVKKQEPTKKKVARNYATPTAPEKSNTYTDVEIVLALDYSNSMDMYGGYKLYSSGKIQKLINMIFAISSSIIDKRSLELFLFEYSSERLPSITPNNYTNYVEKEIQAKYLMGGTNILKPIEAIYSAYINEWKYKKKVFVIFITDGENSKSEFNDQVEAFLHANPNVSIFWQFVGLGSNFTFLKDLTKLGNHVSFFELNDVQSIDNDVLLDRLLSEFPKWYKNLA